MQANSLRDLYVAELRDLYNAETQLVKALTKMAKASSNAELRQGFEEHLRQTSEHVSRLEQIFDMLGEKPTGKKCLGMEGLVKEGAETMKESRRVVQRAQSLEPHSAWSITRSLATEPFGRSPSCWARTSTYLCWTKLWRRRSKRTTS